MTTNLKARFEAPHGALLAIAPQALGVEHSIFAPPTEAFALVANGKAAVVTINGPIAYAPGQFDTYDSIRARFDLALASSAECVVLKINSPGGEVSGTFDTSRYMRARALAAGKKLYTYVEAQASSSGYALASAATEIYCSEAASLGSIGVIQCMKSEARAAAAAGIDFAIITSGERKADGNPLLPISDEARAAAQGSVDTMAGLFFGLVTEHRAIDPKPFQAASFVGAAAVLAGLANGVTRWDSFVDAIATGTLGARTPQEALSAGESKSMPDDDKDKPAEDAVRAALVTASGSDDPEKKARATRALAAYDEDKEKEKAVSAAAPSASDDKPEPKDDDKEKALSATALLAIKATYEARVSALEADRLNEKRNALFASRPDLPPETIKALAGESYESCKRTLALIPVPVGFVPQTAMLAQAPLIGREGAASTTPADVLASLDRAFGLVETSSGVVNKGVVMSFGAPLPKDSK